MKKVFYLLLVIFLASCSNEKAAPKKEDKTPDKEIRVEDTVIVEERKLWDYYVGTVGLYGEEVVMQIASDKDGITGGYWYLKHGKKLTLSGNAAPKSGDWSLEESYKGKTTGKFEVRNTGNTLEGLWYAPNSNERQEVHLSRIIEETEEELDLNFEKYTYDHSIAIYYNGIDGETEDVTDEFRCVKIGDGILFYFDVIGANAHTGSIGGWAKFSSDNVAKFQGEEGCVLTIEFKDDKTVFIDEEDCNYYRGMRALFYGELKKIH